MKQLLLTFFMVIFCYSLFFDKKAEKHSVTDDINYVQKKALTPYLHNAVSDTTNLYTMYNSPLGLNYIEVP